MNKFNIIQKKCDYAFKLYPQSSGTELFRFGSYEVRIDKNGHNQSYCNQRNGHYNYNGITDALRGTKDYFTPKRITVIQMQ